MIRKINEIKHLNANKQTKKLKIQFFFMSDYIVEERLNSRSVLKIVDSSDYDQVTIKRKRATI